MNSVEEQELESSSYGRVPSQKHRNSDQQVKPVEGHFGEENHRPKSNELENQNGYEDSKQRFDQNYFNRRETVGENRLGVPTISNKNRLLGMDESFRILDNQQYNQPQTSEFFNTNSLSVEFDSQERQQKIKAKIEQFIKDFNLKPSKAIETLQKSEDFKSPQQIASFLIQLEGLNKKNLGEFFGDHKESNQQILYQFCKCLKFSGMDVEQALRMLLKRFRLPGEAQQIDRIMVCFSRVYNLDNPGFFKDPDTSYILAYSVIMLNTDLHSGILKQQNQMQRDQFIQNNKKVCSLISEEYLGQIYDRVYSQPIQCQTDYIETVYNRLHMSSLQDLQGLTLKNEMEHIKKLTQGDVFLKYGRQGKPHARLVQLSKDESYIEWKSPKGEKGGDEDARRLKLEEITDILQGHNATEVLRKNKVPVEYDNLCFSIITKDRTLDLKAENAEQVSSWIRYFRSRLFKLKELVTQVTLSQNAVFLRYLSNLWKTDLLPNFEKYYSYETQQFRHLNDLWSGKIMTKKRKESSNTIWTNLFSNQKKSNSQNQDQKDQEEAKLMISEISSIDKQYLLIYAWKQGLPNWVRKTLWPLTVGNSMKITNQLYEVQKQQAQVFLKQYMNDKSISKSLLNLYEDIKIISGNKFFTSNVRARQESLKNIMEVCLFRRPDVAYSKGLAWVCAVFLTIFGEYESFELLCNTLQKFHYQSFFLRGDIQDVEHLIKFFNEQFSKEMPQLYNHFKGLDLGSEFFLLQWMISSFGSTFDDIETTMKVFDNFFIEGEIYLIKVALGILKYKEHELMASAYTTALDLLKQINQEINAKILFQTAECMNVTQKDYQQFLSDIKNKRVMNMIKTCQIDYQE